MFLVVFFLFSLVYWKKNWVRNGRTLQAMAKRSGTKKKKKEKETSVNTSSFSAKAVENVNNAVFIIKLFG